MAAEIGAGQNFKNVVHFDSTRKRIIFKSVYLNCTDQQTH